MARLRQLHPELDLAYVLAQQFVQMLRTRTGEQLDRWLEAVASSPLTDLQSFAGSVYEDKEAILAGLTRAESNGPTEGYIDCPQTDQTRAGYGRAEFDLLRLRVLSGSKKHQRTPDAKTGTDHQRGERRSRKLRADKNTSNSQPTTFHVIEVA